MARKEIENFIVDNEITMTATYTVGAPQDVTWQCFTWEVKLMRRKMFMTTAYRAGIAHSPNYKQGDRSIDHANRIAAEAATGKIRTPSGLTKDIPSPDIVDVLYNLASDSSAIDYPNFEAWANEVGEDIDSRKAEKVYQACAGVGLVMRSALGDVRLSQLREACQDY